MSNSLSKEFWQSQNSSLHRSDSQNWYQKKAEEHAGLMHPNEKIQGIIDLGCGAGELLNPLSDLVKINAGTDYSGKMLDKAKELNNGKNIDFFEADIFELLNDREEATWITTGAINQYLNDNETNKLFEIFSSNNSARSFLLFDTVDPIRYKLLPVGIGYINNKAIPSSNSENKIVMHLKKIYRSSKSLLKILLLTLRLKVKPVSLGSPAMGYGHMTEYWFFIAKKFDLNIEIVSSRYYEYRYHVFFRKK